ncbi:MAG: pimelyl-ACP methyl ester esterase BioV [Helicobacteraceae bacterium]|nr:pimelyl-ACP methyl ester esterase BioV [Helicobacteraceae bacterium]
MKFFSGFGFTNEAELFADYLPADTSYCVVGFSLGAIRAYEYALRSDRRVDRLILLSPAFFQDKEAKFIRLQLAAYVRDRESYMRNFYAACGVFDEKYIDRDTQKTDLELSLTYRWRVGGFERLNAVDIYFGAKDRIVDAKNARDFFEGGGARITYIKNAGHILRIEA